MSDSTPALTVSELRTYFRVGGKTAKAVDGVSLSIAAGETYALVGESGCGKSVTALSILDLIPKPAGNIVGGSIRLGDLTLSGLPPIEMRRIRGNRISMIFQEPMTALNPVFTVGNQISETIRLHQGASAGQARKLAVDMLSKVGIPDPASGYDKYPHQMSGGMRQRVMIAMALACRPEALIADEPTTALDVTIQAQILNLIRQLRSELNTAVLLITHDMGVVRENADRIGVMYAGTIVEEAARDELFSAPRHPYTQLLLRSMPSRAERNRPLAVIAGMVPRATDFPAGCRFNNRCPFVMDRCKREAPAPFNAGPDHYARCFLLDTPEDERPAEQSAEAQSEWKSRAVSRERKLEVSGLKMHFAAGKRLFRRPASAVKAVDGLSIRIDAGETLALVGESGCGKTTVGKCLVRLLNPTAGSITLDGKNMAAMNSRRIKNARRKIQMIFQDPFSSLDPRMRTGRIIEEGMLTHRIGNSKTDRNHRAGELMRLVGMNTDALDRYPHEFSGGQRQRIGLARALAVNPEIIVCDEATSSLDVSIQAQILNLLKRIQNELGVAYLFITHDLSVVRYLADRVAVMYLGRIVEEGTNEEIFDNPAHPYTRALLAAAPSVDESTGRKRIMLAGDIPSPISPPEGCHFHPRCPYATDRCRAEYPGMIRLSPTHTVCCRLHGNGERA